MKKVLLYYMSKNHSVAMETICRTVIESGHELQVLSLCEQGPFHQRLEAMGIKTTVYDIPRKPSLKYFYKHISFLKNFVRKNEIDTVWSHFPEANLIAIIAGRLTGKKIMAFRHHDETTFYKEYGEQFGLKRNRKEQWIDKLINRFAKKIVVLSPQVIETMMKYEHCNEKKLILCPLIYDFKMFDEPEIKKVQSIQESLPCRLRLIMIGRMVPTKQHLAAFEVVNKLIQEGLSIKMIVMDDGPLKPLLEKFIETNNLQSDIIMPGFCDDITNYMAAADMLNHPSVTEASNNVVKEMGYWKKTVAVCRGVGDFDNYIEDNINGYFLDRTDLKTSMEKVIRKAYANPEQLTEMGNKLKESVLQRFSDTAENKERFLNLI